MSQPKLTNDQRALIMDLKTKPLEELYMHAQLLDAKRTALLTPEDGTPPPSEEEIERTINNLQIVIIMIALKNGNYEEYIK